MRIAIGNDHGGLEYKNEVVKYLKDKGYEVINVGTDTKDSCHYPEFGIKVGELVASKQADFGIVICTSGEGIMMAANDVSRLMRQHNNANVIAFGQKFMELNDVLRRIDIFLHTEFEGGRHQTRVSMIEDYEK